MANLLDMSTEPRSSQESFRSARSENHPSLSSRTDHEYQQQSQKPLYQALPTQHSAGISIYDINAYLDQPENRKLLAAAATKNKPKPKSPADQVFTSPECTPIQLGASKSPHHINRLMDLCHRKFMQPVFEFEEDTSRPPRFLGKLTVGGQTIVLDEPEVSKKDVKQVLAERGYAIVEQLSPALQRPADEAASTENWVGKLLEYTNTLPTTNAPPTWSLYTPTPQSFAFEVLISARPNLPFGNRSIPSLSKKAAKNAAAKEAIAYLISTGELSPSGTPNRYAKQKPKNKAPQTSQPDTSTTSEEVDGQATTYVQRVINICPSLGLNIPVYKLSAASNPDAPNVWSGAAWFENEPQFREGVGEVRNVFGKKRAREECARNVWAFLQDLMAMRLGGGGGDRGE